MALSDGWGRIVTKSPQRTSIEPVEPALRSSRCRPPCSSPTVRPPRAGSWSGGCRGDGFELVASAGARPDVVLAGDDVALERWRGEAPVIVLGRPEAIRSTASVRSAGAATTTCRGRSTTRSWSRGSTRCCGERACPPTCSLRGRSRSTRARTLVSRPGTRSTSRRRSTTCCCASPPTRRACSRRPSCCATSGTSARAPTRTVDSHVSRLRRKLRAFDTGTELLENVWGVGYRLLGASLEPGVEVPMDLPLSSGRGPTTPLRSRSRRSCSRPSRWRACGRTSRP